MGVKRNDFFIVRKSRRIRQKHSPKVYIITKDSKEEIIGYLYNTSEGGACIKINKILEVCDIIKIIIRNPNNENFIEREFYGEIRYTNGGNYFGIELDNNINLSRYI
jgi:hypothetical protein